MSRARVIIEQMLSESYPEPDRYAPGYPPLRSLRLTNDQIRGIKTIREREVGTLPGGNFPKPKGYTVIQVDGELDGKPIKFTTVREFM